MFVNSAKAPCYRKDHGLLHNVFYCLVTFLLSSFTAAFTLRVRSCGRAFCPWLCPLLCRVTSSPLPLMATRATASVVAVFDRRVRARGARHILCSISVCHSLLTHRPPLKRVAPDVRACFLPVALSSVVPCVFFAALLDGYPCDCICGGCARSPSPCARCSPHPVLYPRVSVSSRTPPPVQRVPPSSSDHSILFYESFVTLKTAVGR